MVTCCVSQEVPPVIFGLLNKLSLDRIIPNIQKIRPASLCTILRGTAKPWLEYRAFSLAHLIETDSIPAAGFPNKTGQFLR